jgi:hypothetical protein
MDKREVMINYAYPFPRKDLLGGKSAELCLELTQVFYLGYFRVSAINIDNVWIDDILIGDRTLLPELPSRRRISIPLEVFVGSTLTFGDEIIPVGVPLRIKLTNHSKNMRNIRIVVVGEVPELTRK